MSRRRWTTFTRDVLRHRQYDIVRFTRMQALENLGIDLILDVGANIGQFGLQMRRLGFSGALVSFEPLSQALDELRTVAHRDGNWAVRPEALGEIEGEATIHVTRNLVSSSLLEQRDVLRSVDPSSAPEREESISVRRLDSIFDEVVPSGASCLLKIDTQGFEREVLLGAGERLADVAALHLEVSLVELYGGEFLLREALEFLESRGFHLITLEPSLPDGRTGQLLQVDLTLAREDLWTLASR